MSESKPWLFITGGNGFIGQALQTALSKTHRILCLERFGSPNNPQWAYQGALDACQIKHPAAVIHLAGAPTDGQRWTRAYQKRLMESRINGTHNLIQSFHHSNAWPDTLIGASAIGFYGHRPNQVLDENTEPGDLFVSKLASEWEHVINKSTNLVKPKSHRAVILRFGMVLGTEGGALKKMLLPFKLGLGATLGHGRQMYSWISLTDVIGVVQFLLNRPDLSGTFNTISPNSVSNRTFTKTLASQLNRPACLNIPQALIKVLYGTMGKELLLADLQVEPKRLLQNGYKFRHPELTDCLGDLLS